MCNVTKKEQGGGEVQSLLKMRDWQIEFESFDGLALREVMRNEEEEGDEKSPEYGAGGQRGQSLHTKGSHAVLMWGPPGLNFGGTRTLHVGSGRSSGSSGCIACGIQSMLGHPGSDVRIIG